MTDFTELFELEQTVRAGELLVKAVGKFAPKENARTACTLRLGLRLTTVIMMVPFYSKRATLWNARSPGAS